MFADPSQVHHFADFGYRHDTLWQCPGNAVGGQLPEVDALSVDTAPSELGFLKYKTASGSGKSKKDWDGEWAPETADGIGCRCECDGRKGKENFPRFCLDKLRQPVDINRPWGLSFH
jgi:mannosyltransferase